ncbi:Lrp/AsnC family transcriptional regulator [Chthonobacter albigriseus]|uniref:Lrp/AsnC family transcriptional regulator n=1 Tax=Chthonobacter albigriseus TaxID=1683161 RepID=UPI0015EF8417|nr:Lrp/AsnC family transcriptional regulator [Chthonobacter albigriseus]
MKLDPVDRTILVALQEDGSLTNAELAERIHMSPSACLRRTKMLQESGLIAKTVALLDPRLAGLPGTAYVFVTLDSQGRASLDKFEAAVRTVPEITECYLLAGQSDYLLRIVYRDTTDLERIHTEILTPLPGVVRVQSTLTLRAVKRTTKLPI